MRLDSRVVCRAQCNDKPALLPLTCDVPLGRRAGQSDRQKPFETRAPSPVLLGCAGVRLMASDPRLVQLTDCECAELSIPQWQVNAGEGWCVFGRNGSGKQLIDQLLVGDIPPGGAK